MTPPELNHALRPEVSAREAHALIAQLARAHLVHNVTLDGDMVSTTTLVEALYPQAFVRSDEAKAARDRIFKALTKRALGRYDLADCMTLGPEQRLGTSHFRGQPCLWHAPRKKQVCPHCGQEWKGA